MATIIDIETRSPARIELFEDREISITLTGRQWFALIASMASEGRTLTLEHQRQLIEAQKLIALQFIALRGGA